MSDADKAADRSAVLSGALWMVCGGAGWTAMALLVRHLSSDFSPFQLLLFRNVVAVAILLPSGLRGGSGSFRTGRLGLHCLRAAFSYVAVLALFYAVGRAPLPDVTALSFTQPLFVVILAALILHERVVPQRWVAVMIGLLGLLVIVRPGFTAVTTATLAVVLSAVCYASANICVKRLLSTDTPKQAVIYFNLLMLPMALVPALFAWITPGWHDLLLMVGIGIAGTGAVYGYARAFAAAEASAVMPFDFLRLPLAALAAFVLFTETGDVWTWTGSAIIFASSLSLARAESRRK